MENSNISWTDHTFNSWIGCSKVSEGCKNCFAENLMDHRYKRVKWGEEGTRERTSENYWKQPLKWNKRAGETGVREKVFCASLSDVFEDRPELEEWRLDLFRLIVDTPNLDWLVLTKRPENVNDFVDSACWPETGCVMFGDVLPDNVWIGTSAENQEQVNRRIPELLDISASKHFLSIEPLLGSIDLHFPKRPNPNNDLWVIVGGESGKDARPLHPDWVRSLRDQCVDAGVPFFFKQWGEYAPASEDTPPYMVKHKFMFSDEGTVPMVKVGKKKAGCLLDGREWKEFPK